MTINEIEIQECSYHRNGISGLGFHAIRFRFKPDDSDHPENFVATLFEEQGACAILSLDRIDNRGVAFARGNSWRGDHFEEPLRKYVESKTTAHDN